MCSFLFVRNLSEVDVGLPGPGVERVLEQVVGGVLGVDRGRAVLDGVVESWRRPSGA